jgi:hypothetical protein
MNELTFLDLVVLKKIDADSSVEKFGSAINTSFFETANLLGTIKIKGYLDIEPSIGGLSKVALTEAGKGILFMAEKKASEPLEPLDNAILHAFAGGAGSLEAVQASLNVRSADLAYHINKLVSQGYADYGVRSGKVNFTLTEQGFNSTGGVKSAPVKQEASTQQTLGGLEEEELLPIRPPASAPPWVAQEEAKQGSADVGHLISDEPAQAHPAAPDAQAHQEHHAHHKKEEKPQKPLTPEEMKKQEKRRRMASKMEHYISEYGPWIILLMVMVFLFLGAIFLMVSRWKL